MLCYTEQDFKKITNVSHETIRKLNKYLNLLINWQKKFNLVSRNSLNNVWSRHFLDSFQILNFTKKNNKILDFGSGAGFPGIVCAICSNNYVYLVDSNKKKISFLNEVRKELNLKNVFIYHSRIENLNIEKNFDVICARAVSSLQNLIKYSINLSHIKTKFIFLKGENVEKEIYLTKKKWIFDLEYKKSITSNIGKILIIKNIKKK